MRTVVLCTEEFINDTKSKIKCYKNFLSFQRKTTENHNFELKKENIFSFTYGDVHFYKVPLGNMRCIYAFKNMVFDGVTVRCMVGISCLARGCNDYENFFSAPDEKTIYRTSGLKNVDWDIYAQKVQEEIAQPSVDVTPLPELSYDEIEFLNEGITTKRIFSTCIFESRDWINAIVNDTFKQFSKLANALREKIETVSISDEYDRGFYELNFDDRDDTNVLVFYEPNYSHDCAWFLFGIGTIDEINEIKSKIETKGTDIDKLKNICVRAYPYTVLEDDDLWRDVEKDINSNFILSDEEIEIVSNSNIEYPLFISGRAGSGKSTMLMYMFADFLLRYYKVNEGNLKPPVYLSYSDLLIDSAQKITTNLFEKNHAYTDAVKKANKDFRKEILPGFSNQFWVFNRLVKDCIKTHEPEALDRHFSPENYVSYSVFAELWKQKFGKNKSITSVCGPALCWHVIRTYIKGWNHDAYLTPEDYKDIGRSNHSVSEDNFNFIYENIWDNWYVNLFNDGYWDDQDLTRYCLNPGFFNTNEDNDYPDTYAEERYSAIFCDESQDFTRLEIDFILKISSFAHRKINIPDLVQKLPFVFVGDEFQTLNPTGFSWDSLRSYFAGELAGATESQILSTPGIKSLTRNYRSTGPIVTVSNRVQLLREARTRDDKHSCSLPQVPHFLDEDVSSVFCLNPSIQDVWDKLFELQCALIVPCKEGQSIEDYVNNTELHNFIHYDNGAPIENISIFTPIQAKGLEYPCVAIYGFEDTEELNDLRVDNLVRWFENPKQDPESRLLALKYFFNNVYVSVTRAQRKLFVLSDLKRNKGNSFWNFASNDSTAMLRCDELTKVMRTQLSNGELWKNEDLGYITPGTVSDITGEGIINAYNLAQSTEERGMSCESADLMRQAYARYKDQGNNKDATRCLAFSYQFSSKFKDAGEQFLHVGKYKEATENYFRAFEKEQISIEDAANYISNLSAYIRRLEVDISKHIKTEISLEDLKIDLQKILELFNPPANSPRELEDNADFARRCRNAWKKYISNLIERDFNVSESDASTVEKIISQSESLSRFGIIPSVSILANLAFKSSLYEKAVELWEKGTDRPKQYYSSKCRVLNYPDNLKFRKLSCEPNWSSYVIDDYRNNKSMQLTESDKKVVCEAILKSVDSSKDELLESATFLLSQIKTEHDWGQLRDSFTSRDINYDNELIIILLKLRESDISKVSIHKEDCNYNIINILNKSLRLIQTYLDKDGEDPLGDGVNRKQTFNAQTDPIRINQFSSCNRFILTYLGLAIEQRYSFGDILRYYEWAQYKAVDDDFKRMLKERWVYHKELQIEKSGNSADINTVNEIQDVRNELQLSLDYIIPSIFEFNHWYSLFKDLLWSLNQDGIPVRYKVPKQVPLPSEIKEKKKKTNSHLKTALDSSMNEGADFNSDDNSKIIGQKAQLTLHRNKTNPHAQSQNAKIIRTKTLLSKRCIVNPKANNAVENNESLVIPTVKTEVNNVSSATSTTEINKVENLDKFIPKNIDNFRFKYNSYRSEMIIQHDDDETGDTLQCRIKNGALQDGGDFILQEDNLCFTSNEKSTGFKLHIGKNGSIDVIDQNGNTTTFKKN